MSSPSSTSSGKRKRSSSHLTTVTIPTSSTTDLLQPSSRDASGEEGDESAAPATSSGRHKKPLTGVEVSSMPPSKRARTRSALTADSLTGRNGNATVGLPINREDPGEPSETTEASIDIENRSKRRPSSYWGSNSTARNLEKQEGLMEPPARAGLQDPAGYHTNAPPTGRPVRVYADGVFDLFHLGYVPLKEECSFALGNMRHRVARTHFC